MVSGRSHHLISIEFMGSSSGHGHTPENVDNVTTYLRILRIFRLLGIIKIMRLFDGVLQCIVYRERLLKVVSFMLLYSHLCACVWYTIGCESHKEYGVSWISEDTDMIHDCHADITTNPTSLTPTLRYSFIGVFLHTLLVH